MQLRKLLGINVDWVKNIKNKEDQQLFVDGLLSNPVIERLREILHDRLKDRQVYKEVDYNSHSWAYHAADRNGYVRALNEVLRLLEVKERE